jgi:PIN domain nuclease of toxin-antitoxin system
MRILLDTHTFLWWITDDPRLSAQARKVIRDKRNELLFSAASGWEIAIKARLGRLQLPDDLEQFIVTQLSINTMSVLPIQLNHALHVYTLPDHHRDPFDRMLVAQSQVEELPIVTADPQVSAYDVRTIW